MGSPRMVESPAQSISSRIRAQVRAVWLLQRDLPVPDDLLVDARGRGKAPVPPREVLQYPLSLEDHLDRGLRTQREAAEEQGGSNGAATTVAAPPGFRWRGDGTLEPLEGLVESVLKMRERHVKSHVQQRQEVVDSLPTMNMPTWLSDKIERESRSLKLLDLQREVRTAISACHIDVSVPPPNDTLQYYDTSAVSALSRDDFERRWEEQGRVAEERHRANKRQAFLEEVVQTHRRFVAHHGNVKRLREAVCKQVKGWHKNAEKARDKERTERLAALKDNDFDKYREYVKNAKNERLSELIAKTDGYLTSLAEKMAKSTTGVNDKLKLDHEIFETGGKDEAAGGKEEGASTKGAGSPSKGVNGEEKGEGEEEEDEEKTISMEDVMNKQVKETVLEQPKMCGNADLRLKPYQIQGVQWLVSLYNNNLSGILADEMGLGKTIQVIGLITYIFESKGDPGPFMIIAPLSTITNWAIEFSRWAPTMDVVVYKGTKDVRKQLFRTKLKTKQFQVLIIQYEMTMKSEDLRMLKTIPWSYIIVDEGHRLKNKDSKLFVVLTKEYVSKRKVILTGTPLQNNVDELWNLLNFLLPTVFDTDQDFKTWFSKPFAIEEDAEEEEVGQEEQMVLINRLHQVLRPFMLRRTKNDEDLQLSMPENREVIIKCSLSGLQSIMYRQLQYSTLRSRDDKGNVQGKSFNNIVIRLRQVCNHPYLLDDQFDLGPENIVRSCGKFDVLDRILPKLKEAGHRVLVYSQMVKLLDILQIYVEEKGYRYSKLIGATSSDERADLIEEFNRPNSDVFIFILSTRAGGQGVNLQTADTVIIFDSDWNPMMDEQAKARINRIGQTKQTLVIRLMTPNTVEERMLNRASARLRMGDLVIESGMFKVGASSRDAQEMLKEKMDKDDLLEDISKIDAEAATDEDMNELIMRSDEEFEVWQQMDVDRVAAEKEAGLGPRSRLLSDLEVPEHLLGDSFHAGDRIVLIDDRSGTCKGPAAKPLEIVVNMDDGTVETVHRVMAMHEPVEETEEDLEASRLGRRRSVNRHHSVSHHGLTDAEFTKCLEEDIDIPEYVRKKKERLAKNRENAAAGLAAEDEEGEEEAVAAKPKKKKKRRRDAEEERDEEEEAPAPKRGKASKQEKAASGSSGSDGEGDDDYGQKAKARGKR